MPAAQPTNAPKQPVMPPAIDPKVNADRPKGVPMHKCGRGCWCGLGPR